ncbi:hypothetical protein EJ03DRAFT_329967 [Teratosphaeria nubilosa]|uniref:Uncharacterized protein n=1 Tax=Teratosphaeria nubilosa TaxID=161662 RepID=A0A6G1L0Y7_9PEZI|nr:hypothetical protein EJ03DRAFT_329967 [Teratosphaeria nubilosa]
MSRCITRQSKAHVRRIDDRITQPSGRSRMHERGDTGTCGAAISRENRVITASRPFESEMLPGCFLLKMVIVHIAASSGTSLNNLARYLSQEAQQLMYIQWSVSSPSSYPITCQQQRWTTTGFTLTHCTLGLLESVHLNKPTYEPLSNTDNATPRELLLRYRPPRIRRLCTLTEILRCKLLTHRTWLC